MSQNLQYRLVIDSRLEFASDEALDVLEYFNLFLKPRLKAFELKNNLNNPEIAALYVYTNKEASK